MCHRRQGLTLVGAFLLLAGTGCESCSAEGQAAPSLVEELQKGTVSASDVQSLEFLHFRVRQGWPSSENDYGKLKARADNRPETIKNFIQILKDSSTARNQQPEVHPVSHYYGIVRVGVKDGAHYYVYFELMQENDHFYTYVRANRKNATNPNSAKYYRNEAMADFLRRHDPWYRLAIEEDGPHDFPTKEGEQGTKGSEHGSTRR